MRNFCFILMVCTPWFVQAQSDITRDDLYKVGDTAQFFGLDASNAQPGPAGNGVTWDFSNLPRNPDEDFIVEYADPSAAPNAGQFPEATMVAIQDAGPINAYTFIQANDSQIRLEGLDLPDLGVVTYSDKNLWLNFPLKYNETQSDPFVGTYIFNVQGISGVANRDGQLTTKYDGFGTLILPDGTRVNNVRRLKLDQVVNDVVMVSGFSITTKVETTTYHYFAEDNRLQVFTFTEAKSTVTPPGMTVDTKFASYRTPSIAPPPPTPANRLGAHLTTQGGSFDTEIIVRNPTDMAQTLTLQPFDELGTELASVDVNLGPQAISRVLQQNYFPEGARSFSASGCESCIFSTGYRATSANASTAQVHQINDLRTSFFFYPGEWDALFDGAAIVNAGDEPADIEATQYDDQGNMLTSVTLTTQLAPGGKHLLVFNDILMDNPQSVVKLESDQLMGVMILRISSDFRFLYENTTLPASVDNDAGRWLAHITSDAGGFSTDILIHNQEATPQTVRLRPYAADGTALGEIEQTVAGGETARFSKAALLPSDASHLSVSGSTSCIVSAGYRANRDGASTAMSHEAAPIGQSFFVYPGEWNVLFDGVALINTGNANATITLSQIGDDGQVRQTVTLAEGLAPQAKYLGLFEGLIPEDANTIIKIESDQPLALLSLRLSKDGLYLYNNNPQP